MNKHANLISALRNMADDIENLGAAPFTVDLAVIKQAIAALGSFEDEPSGYVSADRLMKLADLWATSRSYTGSPVDDLRSMANCSIKTNKASEK